MAGAAEIRIKGKAELEAALLDLRKNVFIGLRPALRAAAKVVKDDAHVKTVDEIANIGDQWSMFRIGTAMAAPLVYIAPARRRSGGSPRPNLGGELHDAMQEALDAHQEEITLALDALIDGAELKAGL